MYTRIRSESRPRMVDISENNNDRPKQEENIKYLHPVISEVFIEKDRGTRGRCLYEIYGDGYMRGPERWEDQH